MAGLNQASGVDYEALDEFKRLAQQFAAATSQNLSSFGHLGVPNIIPFEPSRGESAYLVRNGDHYLAHVEEGLGTKHLVLDTLFNRSRDWAYDYAGIAQDAVATIVNDLITLGALPLSIAMHLAVGDASWFNERKRAAALVEGWARACVLAGAVWGPGETPELQGVVEPGTFVLGGSAIGRTPMLDYWGPQRLEVGDAIVFLESSGIHANGLTKARELAGTLPDGYRTALGFDETFGSKLLTPTHIYVPAVAACLAKRMTVHYVANITGHGWRKLMRAPQPLTYRITRLPTERTIFLFLQTKLGYDNLKMYSSYNMGAGFTLFMPLRDAERFVDFAAAAGWPFRAFIAGRVEVGPKQVIIEPLDLPLPGDSMQIR